MSRRYSAEWLDEITSASDLWLRRCNGKPERGVPMNRHSLRIVLAASTEVAVRERGLIVWRGQAGMFTAEPLRSE